MNQYERADVEMGRRAQYEIEVPDEPEPRTIAEFKADLFNAPTSNEIKEGLTLRDDNAPKPVEDTGEIDPGWDSWRAQQETAQESESQAWAVAADVTERSALQNAIRTLEEFEDESQIIGDAVNLAAVSPPAYQAFLEHVAAEYDPEYAAEVGQAVVNTLGAISEQQREIEFQQTMSESEQANVEDAQSALRAVAQYRDMSPQDVERVARAFQEATGQPLRWSMLAVMPGVERAQFLNELAIKTEASERGERLQRFAASFFATPSTDISDGLRIKDGVPRDLPPVAFDSSYAAYRAERSIRAEDEARASQARPKRDSAENIKYQLLAGADEKDWRTGLTDDRGRPTSYDEIAANDPMSERNVQARNREVALQRIATATGARRIP
jgi:hypothetical protein